MYIHMYVHIYIYIYIYAQGEHVEDGRQHLAEHLSGADAACFMASFFRRRCCRDGCIHIP